MVLIPADDILVGPVTEVPLRIRGKAADIFTSIPGLNRSKICVP